MPGGGTRYGRRVPMPPHLAIAELASRLAQVTVVTQNVDGLHQRAGSTGVIELHGNIMRAKCFEEGTVFHTWTEGKKSPPRCSHCGGPLRPDVVWFHENLPQQALDAAEEAIRQCDVLFSIGTSGLVYPAALMPKKALEPGATVVEINPHQTSFSAHATFVLAGKAAQLLPALMAAAWGNA